MQSHVAVASSEGRLSTHLWQDGAGWAEEPGSRAGLWPAPRPGTDEWTASAIADAALLEHDGAHGVEEVPGSRSEPALLLGPRLGHYALWSPAGDNLCYVMPDGRGLSLRTWRPGEPAARILLSGAPLFCAWVPRTNWLLCHHGASLSAFETATGEQRVISTSAAGFRAPAVRADGAVFTFAEVQDGAVRVHSGSLEPRSDAVVAEFPGGVALSYRGESPELTLAVAREPESGVFSELLRVEDGQPRRIVKGPLVAYWWTPAGDRVATLHPSYTGDGRFQMRVHSADGAFVGASESFIPSPDSATMVGFFDQYANSHPAWSPDGRWFGMCGRFLREGPHPSFSGNAGDRAMVWDTTEGMRVYDIGPGQFLAFNRA